MLRNLIVPVALLATALLAGCQTIQDDNSIPASEPPAILPEVISDQPEAELKIPIAEDTNKKDAPAKAPIIEPPPVNIITVKKQIIQTPAHLEGRLILGIEEQASLPDLNIQLPAKLDTGAANTSVDARNIQLFERDSKKWVKFTLPRTSAGDVEMELPVRDSIRIKRPGLKAIDRPVVNMTITIGELTQQVLVSLTNRENYQYPLLIGRDFIQDLAVIDVNQKNIATKSLVGTRSHKIEAQKGKKSYTETIKQPVSINGLTVLGAIENITLADNNFTFKARVDTGAKTSSLDARDIEFFQKNEKNWVRFKTPVNGELTPMEEPVTRFLRIKRHGKESERRPVVTMNVRVGNIAQPAQFSLRNRKDYEFPVLIGVRFLKEAAVVDVSREFISGTVQRGNE